MAAAQAGADQLLLPLLMPQVLRWGDRCRCWEVQRRLLEAQLLGRLLLSLLLRLVQGQGLVLAQLLLRLRYLQRRERLRQRQAPPCSESAAGQLLPLALVAATAVVRARHATLPTATLMMASVTSTAAQLTPTPTVAATAAAMGMGKTR